MFRLRDDLFYSHAGDVKFGGMRPNISISFVGTNYNATSFGNSEIDTGDGSISFNEFSPQYFSRSPREIGGINISLFRVQMLVKSIADLFFFSSEWQAKQYDWVVPCAVEQYIRRGLYLPHQCLYPPKNDSAGIPQ